MRTINLDIIKVQIRTSNRLIEKNLRELENDFKNIMIKTEEKYNVSLSDYSIYYSIYDDISKLILLMKEHNIANIWTDGDGNVFTNVEVPKEIHDKIEELVYNIAWDIDCIICNEFVSDVYVVPIFYKIELNDNKLLIDHETVWENA